MEHQGETLLHLLTDWNHWILEAIAEAIMFTIEVVVLKRIFHLHGRHGR